MLIPAFNFGITSHKWCTTTLPLQLDEKTEKIHELNQKFMKQENELHVLTMEIKAFEDKFSEQKQLSGQKVRISYRS